MAHLMPKVSARGETPEGGRSTEEGSHGHTTDPHGEGGRPRRPGVRLYRAHAPDPGPLTELYPAAARRRHGVAAALPDRDRPGGRLGAGPGQTERHAYQ